MSIGDVHRIVWCTSPFELGGRWRCRGDGWGEIDGEREREKEIVREIWGDGDISRQMEIKNVL
jgi:hypothetical protein